MSTAMMRPRVSRRTPIQDEQQVRLIDAREAANRLGLSVWTVYAWARTGRIASVQLGTRRLFAVEDLDRLIADSRVRGSARTPKA